MLKSKEWKQGEDYCRQGVSRIQDCKDVVKALPVRIGLLALLATFAYEQEEWDTVEAASEQALTFGSQVQEKLPLLNTIEQPRQQAVSAKLRHAKQEQGNEANAMSRA